MSKSLQEWLDYILGLHDLRIDLGLERIQAIADEQNLRTFPCPVVTVAGTNGKGSCVRFLESIYSAEGYRVGAYYSPHIHRFNERIRLQEQEVSDANLIAAFERVESFRQGRPLSFFEFTTLAAFWILKSAALDVIVLEVGLGGRLDAVNVVDPDVAIVSSVGLDHMDRLGDTLDQIAYEKAGVYRAGKPAICGEANPPRSLQVQAEKIGAHWFCKDREFSHEMKKESWSWRGPETAFESLPIPHLKCQNAATSLMAIECLRDSCPVTLSGLIKGIKNARLLGRFQQISTPINAILDVAHNEDSARWLGDQLQALSLPGKKVALVGMLKNKDIPGVLTQMIPHIDIWLVSGLSDDRGVDPVEIMHHLKALGVKNCYNFRGVTEALEKAAEVCTHSDDRVIVFGSFHTVADVQKALKVEV